MNAITIIRAIFIALNAHTFYRLVETLPGPTTPTTTIIPQPVPLLNITPKATAEAVPEDGLHMRAYKCGELTNARRVVDLTQVGPCKKQKSDYYPPSKAQIEVIQRVKSQHVTGHSCRLRRSIIVTRCGFDSISYGDAYVETDAEIPVSSIECKNAVKTGRFKYDDRLISFQLNLPRTYTYYSHGNRKANGKCTTTSFKRNDVWYAKSFESTVLKLLVKEEHGVLNKDSKEIIFSNGIRAPANDRAVYDSLVGVLYWQIPDEKCSEKYSKIFSGNAQLYQSRRSLGTTDAIVTVHEDTRMAGIVLKDQNIICNRYRCYDTQVPDVLVCFGRYELYLNETYQRPPMTLTLPNFSFLPNIDIPFNRLLSTFSLAIVNTALQAEKQFDDILTELCETDRKHLQQLLADVSGLQHPHALSRLMGPGQQVQQAGNVAYIEQCRPISVVLHSARNCTLEIPVSYRNSTWYVEPFTKILQRYPSIVTCSEFAPPRYFIQGTWWCAYPRLSKCGAPEILRPDTMIKKFHPDEIVGDLDKSLYTPEQLEMYRDFSERVTSRLPVVTNIIAAMTHPFLSTGGDHSFSAPFGPETYHALRDRLRGEFFPFLDWTGKYFEIFVGALVILSLIKIVFGFVLRTSIIVATKGCGWEVVAALWTTAFACVLLPWRIFEALFNVLNTHHPELAIPSGTSPPPTPPASPHRRRRNSAPAAERDYVELNEINRPLVYPRLPQPPVLENRFVIDPPSAPPQNITITEVDDNNAPVQPRPAMPRLNPLQPGNNVQAFANAVALLLRSPQGPDRGIYTNVSSGSRSSHPQ